MSNSLELVQTTPIEHTDQAVCATPTSLEDEYQHEPLIAEDAVRVLNLEPTSDFESPLRGFITQHRREVESVDPDGCKYSAVSYTWDGQKLSHVLFLRRGAEWSLLLITQNADLLLRFLRHTDKAIPLWIDGVCLNQKNQQELAQQVPLMGQIYSHAKDVHIWLGVNHIKDAQQAFSLIRRLELELKGGPRLRAGSEDFSCLERFFNRPWFSRRWVIQELFFAHNPVLHCGHHTLSLSRVMAVLDAPIGHDVPGYGSTMLRSSLGFNTAHKRNLLSLLWDLHESKCSDRRDRVAAIYALADSDKEPPLRYDIGSWEKMYMNIASHCLCVVPETTSIYSKEVNDNAHKVLSHLCSFGSIDSGTGDGIPSWVPNWSAKRQQQMPLLNPIRNAGVGKCSWYRSSLDIILRPRSWKQAQNWYEEWLQWDDNASPQRLELSGRKLQMSYDFLTFIYACGILDQAIYPGSSEDFWDEFVREKRHHTEVESLSLLLIGILGKSDAAALHEVNECIKALFNRGHEKASHGLSDNVKVLLRRLKYGLKDMALLRVQSTVGYHWVIGSPSLMKGDWLTPIVPPESDSRPPRGQIVEFMSLRPIGSGEARNSWYPYPGSDPETLSRRLTSGSPAEIDSLHITARFAGSGRGFFTPSLAVDEKLENGSALWKVCRKATETANSRGLPGPVIFDIV